MVVCLYEILCFLVMYNFEFLGPYMKGHVFIFKNLVSMKTLVSVRTRAACHTFAEGRCRGVNISKRATACNDINYVKKK